MKRNQIIITVNGGVAEVSTKPNDIDVYIIDYDNIGTDYNLEHLAICGTCGTHETDKDSKDPGGFCKNDHDNWVEVRDFFLRELEGHVDAALDNLGLTRDELMLEILKKNNSDYVK